MREYDLHKRGSNVSDALAKLDLAISAERGKGRGVFCVVTGYGSTGGTALIKDAVLDACRRYRELYHIRGYLDGELAADMFCPEALAFPDLGLLPSQAFRSPNPGVVYICV